MSTLKRLNEQLAQLENWTETLERLEEIKDDPYWAWDQTQLLIREIEEDTDLEAWAQRLTPQERAASDLPPNYAYTHLVLLPFVRTYLDKLPDDEELDLGEERLEDEHPSALLWLATSLSITSSPTLEGQRLLGWYVDEDEEYSDDDDEEELDEDEEDEDEDEDEDLDEDEEQTITLSIEGFYTRLNALCALSPTLQLQNLYISANEFREDMVQRLDGLSALPLPKLKSLTLELTAGNTRHLRELLEWSAAQPELESIYLEVRDLSSEHTLIDKAASPKRITLLHESHTDQRPLFTLFSSPLFAAVEEVQIFEQMTWRPEEERRHTLEHDELLPALAPHLPLTLETLFLSYNQTTQLDLNALADLQDSPQPKGLTINLATFTPGSLEALLSSPFVSDLESLTLTSNKLRDEDAELIASMAPETLTHLSLDRNLLTQEGAVALATSPRLQGLQHFNMYGELLHVADVSSLYTQFRDRAHRSTEERFGELRSLLQSPPDEESWEQLCAILDIWPDMEQLEQEVIPYVLSYTERWPIDLCTLPNSWLWRAKEGLPAPMLKLVTMTDGSWSEGEDVEEVAQLIGHHPHLNRLRSLVLDYTYVSASALTLLAHSPNIQGLTALSISELWGEEADQSVFLSTPMPSLQQLHIKEAELTEIFPLLLQAPYMKQLTTFELSNAELDREQLQALIKTGLVVTQLERLTLSQCELDLASIKSLLTTHAPHLKHLNLPLNALNTPALVTILQSSLGAQLTSLNFAYNDLDEGNAFSKLQSAALHLEHLNLSCTNIPERALKSLAQCAWLQHLKVLDLSGNDLQRSKGLKAFIQSPYLGSLEQLILRGNYLTQEEYELIHHTMTLPQAVRDQFHPDKWDEYDYMEDIFE